MSEHLGPIHYMMYEKICFQDEITEKLLSKEDKKELDTLHSLCSLSTEVS